MIMVILHSLAKRGAFLASALSGAIGVFLPVTVADAETATTATDAAALAQPREDTAVRPFKFHASANALADLRPPAPERVLTH
jgi:hypothetical protein